MSLFKAVLLNVQTVFRTVKQRIISFKNSTTMAPETANETSENSTCVYVDSTARKLSILCAYCLILLGSFLGNSFIIIIFYKHRDLRKTINYFIVNMAVSDLLFPLIAIPHQIAGFVSVSWHWRVTGILGSIFCKLYLFVVEISLFVSAQSLVWIAIDRFVAVVFPIKRGLISTKIRTIAIVSTWIFGGIFYFPMLITWGLVERDNNTFCSSGILKSTFPSEEVGKGYYWLHLTLRFFLPLFLITVLYTTIAISLKRQSKALSDTIKRVRRRNCLKKRRQAIQMAVVVVVLFYICVFPYALLRLIYGKVTACVFQRPFYLIAVFMWYSSAIVNPIICLSFVESYRRGLRNILCPCSRRQNNRNAKREEIHLKAIENLPD